MGVYLSLIHTPEPETRSRTSSPALTPSGLAHLYPCHQGQPAVVHGQGAVFSTDAVGEGRGQLCAAFGYQYNPRRQLRLGTSTWHLVVTWAMDIDTDMIWDFTMALGGFAGYSYQAVPLHPHVSRSTSLHRAQTVLLLFLSRLSTLYLYFVVAHASHRHVLGGVSECLPAYSSWHWVGPEFLQVFVQPKTSKGNKSLAKVECSMVKLSFNIKPSGLMVEPLLQPSREISL